MVCEEFADLAAEMALGVLTGNQRAEAIAHLDVCGACREHVGRLTDTAAELLALLAASQPPPGFETRVMERLGHAVPSPVGTASARCPEPRSRGANSSRLHHRPAGCTRRTVTAAAVTVAVAGAGLGGWGLAAAARAPARSPLSSAVLVNSSRRSVGQVFFHKGSPRWLYMEVDIGRANGTVTCQLIGTNGRAATVGSFRLANGLGSWSVPVPAAQELMTSARLIGADGRVLATAVFPAG